MLNSLAVYALLLMQLTYPVVTLGASSRALFFTAALSAYLIYAHYTCDLVARMTSTPPEVPIREVFRDVFGVETSIGPIHK